MINAFARILKRIVDPSCLPKAGRGVAAAAVAVALLSAGTPSPALSAELTDKDGKAIRPADAARIVSIGGAITEIIYRLGAEKQIVAVDTTSLYPPAALKTHPDVGYLRALSAEGILSMRPTLIIADAAAGPPPALRQLRAAGTRLVVLRDDPSPNGVVYKIHAVARLLGKEAAGMKLATAFQDDMHRLSAAIAKAKTKPRVLFLLSVGRGAPLVAGRNTSADAIIRLAGGVNAVRGYDRYKPLSPEAAVAARPDVILTVKRTEEALGGKAKIAARREIAPTPAGRNGRVVAMNGLYLLGFGPRTPMAVRDLARRLHPGLALPPLATETAYR